MELKLECPVIVHNINSDWPKGNTYYNYAFELATRLALVRDLHLNLLYVNELQQKYVVYDR